MIGSNLFQGELVRLTAENPELAGAAFSRWSRDSEYLRLLDTDQAQLWSAKKFKHWIEKDIEKENTGEFFFYIRTLDGDHLIGFVGLFEIQWNHADAWVGIGVGDRQYWDKGYGTDAMRVILRYAFKELNLYRVTLGTFAYNSRAIRSYEKAGFTVEGQERQVIHRDGSRADVLIMSILHEEFEAVNKVPGSMPK